MSRRLRVELRLRQLLQRAGFCDAHGYIVHGRLGELERITGADRHTITRLCRGGDLGKVRLGTIEKIAAGLQDHLPDLAPEEIIKLLFGAQQSSLLEEIGSFGRVRMCVSIYVRSGDESRPHYWIAPNDARAMTVIVESLSSLPKPRPMIETEYVPFHLPAAGKTYTSRQYLDEFREDKGAAEGAWERIRGPGGRAAWILVGSMRTNYVVEYMVANLFGVTPFEPGRPRRVPFFLSYRDYDHRVRSCFGDFAAFAKRPAGEGGIHYKNALGRWEFLPWREEGSDAGVVIVQRNEQGLLEGVSVFGFSGRATVAVARLVADRDRSESLGPPYASVGNRRQIGVYVCRLDMADPADFGVEVIPVAQDVLERSAKPSRRKGRRGG